MASRTNVVRAFARCGAVLSVLAGLFFGYAAGTVGRTAVMLLDSNIRYGNVSGWELVWILGAPVLVVLSWAFICGLPPRLWRFPEVRRGHGGAVVTAAQLLVVVAVVVVWGFASAYFFPGESYSTQVIDGHTAWMRMSDPDSVHYYGETGRRAVEEHGNFGITTWNFDGTVKHQERLLDANGVPVNEHKTSPPWWWGVENETAPSAPWWTGEPEAWMRDALD